MTDVWIINKKPDAPMGNLVSVGETKDVGGYVSFRGDATECLKLLLRAAEELEDAIEEGIINEETV